MELAFGNHQSESKTVEFGELPKGSRGLRPVFGYHPHAMRNGLYWRQKHHLRGDEESHRTQKALLVFGTQGRHFFPRIVQEDGAS